MACDFCRGKNEIRLMPKPVAVLLFIVLSVAAICLISLMISGTYHEIFTGNPEVNIDLCDSRLYTPLAFQT